ncbi:MAG TPA: chemotaxis protein CheB [Candidatus Limnocylindria bacterium]|nr:chemotaxis protein CheB [Candidatus Limnocylindria bacterium]
MAKSERHPLVVVGSSAGGIDALSELVATLPGNFPAPIVVAQHLDPRRPSHLSEILERRSPLKVVSVTGAQKMSNGVIYIVPADRDVDIVDGTVKVHQGDVVAGRPRPSVDHLFATAADAYGENLIAVVLTGAGSDGTEGARRVKLAGGTVVIQDPATARFPSMPQSLAPTTVDVVARLDTIGQVLVDLVTVSDAPPEQKEEQILLRFLNRLREQTGIDFAQYKRPTILRRLRRRMAAVRAATLSDYVRYASRNPKEYERVASAFLIKVTEFFRDPELYETLRRDVLPRLISEGADAGRDLRIWSAGCATGEEAYSLAILVAEALGDELARRNVRVFATDLDSEAIAFARRGIYSRSAVANLPEELIDRYFIRIGDEVEVRKGIRGITIFGQHDLAQRAPFPRIDLAVSRNVLIYFTPELQRRALQLFAFSLREGGYLVLGKAESVSPLPEYFVLENARLKVYRRHGDRVVIPAARGLSLTEDMASIRRHRPRPVRVAGGRSREMRTPASRSDQVLLRLPVGVVVVAQDYDIQMINTAARQQLAIHGTAVGQDFVHVAREIPSQVLREGIDKARAGEDSTTTIEMQGVGRGVPRDLQFAFIAHHADAERQQVVSVIVVVSDITGQRKSVDTLSARLARSDEETAAARHQVEAIEEANGELLRANQELTTANAELRSANEELLVGSEEVQAATEEVETLNEELQATNEELETLNEELQATVEELNTTNDDLEARGVELEETLASLAEQRRVSDKDRNRLTRLLFDYEQGMLVVDNAGNAILSNAAWKSLSDGPEATLFERPGEGSQLTVEQLLRELTLEIAQGDGFAVDLQAHGPRGGLRRYELRGEALRDDRGRLRGSIVTMSPKRATKTSATRRAATNRRGGPS